MIRFAIVYWLIACVCMLSFADVRGITLLDGATATGTSTLTINDAPADKSCQASASTSSGTGSAVVDIEGSNDNSNWITLGTITLSPTTSGVTDGFAINAIWRNIRANLSTVSGTGSSVTVNCAYEYIGGK